MPKLCFQNVQLVACDLWIRIRKRNTHKCILSSLQIIQYTQVHWEDETSEHGSLDKRENKQERERDRLIFQISETAQITLEGKMACALRAQNRLDAVHSL